MSLGLDGFSATWFGLGGSDQVLVAMLQTRLDLSPIPTLTMAS